MRITLTIVAAMLTPALLGTAAAQDSSKDLSSFQAALVISKPSVKTPKEAKKSGLGGPVNVYVSLDPTGNVVSVDNIAGPGWVCKQVQRPDVVALREAARAAAFHTRFSPAKRSGIAEAAFAVVTFEFRGDKDNGENLFVADNEAGEKVTKYTVKGDRNYSSAQTVPPDYKGPVNTTGTQEPGAISSEAARKNVSETLSGGVLNGKAEELPKPRYPPAARAVKVSGSVPVQVLIDEKGEVFSAKAVGGHPLLKTNAVDAACRAKFMPTLLSGQPVKVSGIITYNFVP